MRLANHYENSDFHLHHTWNETYQCRLDMLFALRSKRAGLVRFHLAMSRHAAAAADTSADIHVSRVDCM